MRNLIVTFLFLAASLRAQVPTQMSMAKVVGFTYGGSSQSADISPAGTPGAMWYWTYTNTLLNTFTTNWVDQISGLAFKWDTTRVASTRATNSSSGVYFDGFNGSGNMTSAPPVILATSTMSNVWEYISFKPNHFSYNPIYIWGDSGTAHGYISCGTDKILRYTTSGGPGSIALSTALAANVQYDLILCTSNGFIWSWTNGVASVVAGAFGFNSGNNFCPMCLGASRTTGNWYDGFIQEVAAGTNGFGGQFFGGVQASNLHFWRTNAVIFSSP